MKLDFLVRMYQEYNQLDTKIISLEKALKTKEDVYKRQQLMSKEEGFL